MVVAAGLADEWLPGKSPTSAKVGSVSKLPDAPH
jgi:hypothetical protein